jgi:hypothetical protein
MSQLPHFSDQELARAWIRRFSQNRRSILLTDSADSQMRDERLIEDETKWAFDAFEELVDKDATRAWAVILRILEMAHPDASVLNNLSAGPLETLLVRHGWDVLEWVEAEATSNPKFKDLLEGLWGNAIDETVWERVQALSRE